MKRLSKLERWRYKRRITKIKRKIVRILIKEYYYRIRESRKRDAKIVSETIVAPIIFSIDKNVNRNQLTKFLVELRILFSRKDIQKIIIDFTNTRQFIAAGTLLFYAELCRLIEMTDNYILVRYRPPLNDKATEVLKQIGLNKICGVNSISKRRNFSYADVVHWKVAQGVLVDNTICAPAIESYEGKLAEPLLDDIFRGLAEAMTNTIHHAYIDDRKDGLNYLPPNKNWWMFSQAKNDLLSVVFCDLGIGIPRSLPLKKPGLFKQIISWGKADSDSAYIEIAIEDGRTRTRTPGRGRGLGDVIDIVTKQKSGTVVIFSNKGMYFRNETKSMTTDLKESILGTIICWQVPLEKANTLK